MIVAPNSTLTCQSVGMNLWITHEPGAVAAASMAMTLRWNGGCLQQRLPAMALQMANAEYS